MRSKAGGEEGEGEVAGGKEEEEGEVRARCRRSGGNASAEAKCEEAAIA
jgi:hypothetical protein